MAVNPPGRYVGTAATHLGVLGWHVFEDDAP